MREIKFRMWDTYEGVSWEMIYQEDYNCCQWENLGSNDTMQYTWLDDKNWKEIYESDNIKYNDNDWNIVYTMVEYKNWWFHPFCMNINSSSVEIVWNIYNKNAISLYKENDNLIFKWDIKELLKVMSDLETELSYDISNNQLIIKWDWSWFNIGIWDWKNILISNLWA